MVYRAIAEYKLRESSNPAKNSEILEDLQRALASVRLQPNEKSSVERDLFLADLALVMTELGGSEDEEIDKRRYDWKGKTIRDELMRVLEAIRAPEARALAMRAMVTRLIEKEQPELAISLASQLSNTDKKGSRPPATSQLAVIQLLKGQTVERVKVPASPKDRPEPMARIALAESYARKGNYDDAKRIAFYPGPPNPEQLEACVGAAQAILQVKGGQAKDAEEFVDRALEIVTKQLPDPKKVSPWVLLQAIRVVARVKGSAAAADLPKKLLPPDFQPRGYLEVVLAEADASTTALGPTNLADIAPTSVSLDVGWEALARQNARIGARDMRVAADDEANARFQPMVHIGSALGKHAPVDHK
jgi:hypothetical protein